MYVLAPKETGGKMLPCKNAGARILEGHSLFLEMKQEVRKETCEGVKGRTEKAGGRDNLSVTVTIPIAEDRQQTSSFLGLHDSGFPNHVLFSH